MDIIDEKKYVGNCCGNSFVIFDQRNFDLDDKTKSYLAVENIMKYNVDSALFINNIEGYDLYLEIFERDGSQSDACGNGLLLIAFMFNLNNGVVKFRNSDFILTSTSQKLITLFNICSIEVRYLSEKCMFIRVGEPHVVYLVDDVDKVDVVKIGEEEQKKHSTTVNVDFIQKIEEHKYKIRTYERGVFSVTESCGTGSLSSYVAISHLNDKIYSEPIMLESSGGVHWISKAKNMLRLETFRDNCDLYSPN